jgi:hypothetical protein
MRNQKVHVAKRYGANDLGVSVPTFWAFEGMNILVDSIIMPFLVNRNYENYLMEAGDTVRVTKPLPFKTNRKGDADDKTVQDAKLSKGDGKLDDPYDNTFILKDKERSLSNEELIGRFLTPAMAALATTLNRKIYATAVLTAYANNRIVGGLGSMSVSNGRSLVLDAGLALNRMNCPLDNRNAIWTPQQLRYLQSVDTYFNAASRGDGGLALRDAMLGRVDGFDHFCTSGAFSVAGFPTIDGEVVGAKAKGYTGAITVDGFTSGETDTLSVGQFVTIEDDDTPYRITALAEATAGTATSMTLDEALRNAIADNADVYACTTDTVNLTAGYLAGYGSWIVTDWNVTPQVGQMVAFGATAASAVYCIIDTDATNKRILLDRALEANLADGAAVNYGPNGEFGLAMRPDFVTFFCRPQVMNSSELGAAMYTITAEQIAMRIAMQSLVLKAGTIITADVLCGATGLDDAQGTLVLG